MAAVTVKEMRALERVARDNGWSEESLMNLAGENLGLALANRFPNPGTVIAYLGKGHNAGDALVAIRVMRDRFGWEVTLRSAFPPDDWAPLTQKKWHELGRPNPQEDRPVVTGSRRPRVLLDGLLGIGGMGPLRDPLLELANEMRTLRETGGARVAAVDLPSGVDSDTGERYAGAVEADITFMIGCAKRGLLTAKSIASTGALAIVPVAPLSSAKGGNLELISPQTSDFHKSPRPFDFHKGLAGKIGVLAGSLRYAGAAVLAASGALRGGAGLVTLHVPPEAVPAVSSKSPPELIVKSFKNPRRLSEEDYDAWVIGCGLDPPDEGYADGVLELISRIEVPAVIDAEALNLVSRRNRHEILTDRHVITPHPGEFKRLAADLYDLPREEAVRVFASRSPATLLLKGSRTLVCRHGSAIRCNSTGHPGMSTGGQGDILAGVIGALLPGNDRLEAAALAAWVCGRAAERALDDVRISEESLLPSDVLLHLGGAFSDWRTASR